MEEKDLVIDLTKAVCCNDYGFMHDTAKRLVSIIPYNETAVNLWVATTIINYNKGLHWEEEVSLAWHKFHTCLTHFRQTYRI